MNNKATGTSAGVSFFGLLTILFIGLKLTGKITWSWLWVLSPIWLPTAFVVLCVILAVFAIGRK